MRKKEEQQDWYEKEERMQKEIRRMKAGMPPNAAFIQCYVEDACDRMDYEGSRIYDECPDTCMLRRSCEGILKEIRDSSNEMEAEACRNCRNLSDNVLMDFIELLFLQEVHQRRCRRGRCPR